MTRAVDALSAGSYAYNLATGEVRLVIEYSPHRDEVTFSGFQRWESAKPWRTSVLPAPKRSAGR